MENLGCHILDGPPIHGSSKIVKGFDCSGGDEESKMGWNDRRKEASPFRCLIVKDILKEYNDSIQETGEVHSLFETAVRLLFQVENQRGEVRP